MGTPAHFRDSELWGDMTDIQTITRSGTALIANPAWDTLVDRAGTPFHSCRFLLPWWRENLVKNPSAQLIAVMVTNGRHTGTESRPRADSEAGVRAIGVCAFEISAGTLSFAGGHDVVDYMGPVAEDGREKAVAEALARWIFEEASWSSAHLAGLAPSGAAAQEFMAEVQRRAPSARVETYDQAPVLEAVPGGYLAALNSKRRLDVQRKRNRLIEEVGPVSLESSTPQTLPDVLDRLLAWKAAAGSATSDFVVEYGGMLRDLLSGFAPDGTGHVVELRAGSLPLASAIVFRHRGTDYLYNMAYDTAPVPGAAPGLAPGVVLVSHLAEQALAAGRRFDFLRGTQDYKRRLGGVPQDLAAVVIGR